MKRDLLRAAGLALSLSVLFCLAYGRTSLWAWQTPIQYVGDAVSFLAQLKAARDGHVVPVAATFDPDLNAPYEANWNDYPRAQKTFMWLAGQMARVIGVFPTANLLLLLAHVLAGLTFYGVARYLRARPAWAAAGAMAFACSHYIWYRNLSHLALSLYWHIPLDILVVGWCFRRHGLAVRSGQFVGAVLVALVAALFNVYYAALFAQLLMLSALAQVVRGTWRKAAAPVLLSGAVVGLFALESLGTLLYPREHGVNLAAVNRSYADLEHYALKPVEFFLPPPGSGLFHYGSVAAGYWENARGEIGSAYLGLAALAGLGVLLAAPLLGLVYARRVAIRPALGAVVWIVAFSVAGGINGVLGSMGVIVFRGTNRYSIWVVAVALLYLVTRMPRRPRWGGPVDTALAGLFTVIALVDQVPGLANPGGVEWQRRMVEMDRAFAEGLETALPGRTMVFMLPVLDSPEGGWIRQMADYEHLRPYLFTSRVHYSYGTDKGRSREEWQHRVEAMVPAKMIDRLEAYGFSGIVIDRRGLNDGGDSLLAGLAAAGRPVTLAEPGRGRAFVRLRPHVPARLPETAPRFGDGWYGRAQDQGIWARATSAVWLVDPGATPLTVSLSFELTVTSPRTVTLSQGDRVIASWRPDPTATVSDLRLVLPAGESRLVLTTDRDLDVAEVGNRLRYVAFAIKDLEMKEE